MNIFTNFYSYIYSYKRWIVIFSLVSLSIGSGIGGYYYLQHTKRESHLRQASHIYLQLINASEKDGFSIAPDKVQAFIQQYCDTPYTALLQLRLAKHAIDRSQLADALKWLKQASQHATDPDIRCIARQRGARVLAAMGQLTEALQFLEEGNCSLYVASIEDIKGDILRRLGKREEAMQAYQRAYIAGENLGISPSFVMMLSFKIINEGYL